MPQKKALGLSTQIFTRGIKLAKASLGAGRFAAHRWFNPDSDVSAGWLRQIEHLVQELGQLKGTAMKVGQTLSLYGESLFSKEVNDIFKTLQQKSQPLGWDLMEPVLLRELGMEKYQELQIDSKPLASASIGQVYRAQIKATGEWIALKVQYPGVDLAVETDMKLLGFILGLPGVFPGGLKMDQVLSEIKDMFTQELDYAQEFRFIELFKKYLENDPRYYVPRPFARYSTPRVLATELAEGHRADAEEVQALSLERRNRLGAAFLDLYLRELLEFKMVQTDPHLGNYMVQIQPSGEDRLVLFDFGAVRAVPEDFLISYQHLIYGSLQRDSSFVEKGGRGLKLLLPNDPQKLVLDYVDLCFLLTEPFASDEPYDWANSDLPKRVAGRAAHVAFNYKLRAPPKELVFLDRKLGGVFIFLSVLKSHWSGRAMVFEALTKHRNFP